MKDLRVKFQIGKQREFIQQILKNLNSPSLKNLLSYDSDISYSALKKYAREESLMPLSLVKELCELSRIDFKSLNLKYLNSNWGAIKGGKAGIKITLTRHKDKLDIWRKRGWEKTLKYLSKPKEIKEPLLNEELAELIGVYLGDGTLTKYFMKISGDYRYDLPYFNYLSKLIFNLFGLKSKISKENKRNTAYLTIFSKNFCSFFKDKYNFDYGDKIKNKSKIPEVIMKDKKLSVACLRGLVDTDGSVSRRGRNGSQFCIHFCAYSPELLNQVKFLAGKYKIFTYFSDKGAGTNNQECIKKYFKFVGSSTLKHIIRYRTRFYENKTLYLKEVPNYFKKDLYREMSLPFKDGPVV